MEEDIEFLKVKIKEYIKEEQYENAAVLQSWVDELNERISKEIK
tara:strand:+ start:230 stop:361 length:132 start_codon:yes stop_codon:yes gene_type:complete